MVPPSLTQSARRLTTALLAGGATGLVAGAHCDICLGDVDFCVVKQQTSGLCNESSKGGSWRWTRARCVALGLPGLSMGTLLIRETTQ